MDLVGLTAGEARGEARGDAPGLTLQKLLLAVALLAAKAWAADTGSRLMEGKAE